MNIDDYNVLPITGFDGYMVSDCGIVFSNRKTKTFQPLAQSKKKTGYFGLLLRNNAGEYKNLKVHRLVAKAFIENPENLPCVRHLDGNKGNNAVENLAWGSYKDNEADKIIHGTYYGRSNVLTESDVVKVRKLAAAGNSYRTIGEWFGVDKTTIGCVVRRVTWGHI